MMPFTLLALAVLSGVHRAAAEAGASFRGLARAEAERTVSSKDIELSLQESVSALFGEAAVPRRQAIEVSLWPSFQALPKNSFGRLGPRAVRYAVHSYFAKEHGWQIKGLEPHGHSTNVSEVHDVSILQDKAPALVEALLETRRADRGLSLTDLVLMVAALERLIFDESLSLLEVAYKLNGRSASQLLEEAALHDVLTSYLLIFELGARGNLSDVRGHQALKASAARAGGNWATILEFEQDAVWNLGFARQQSTNPFVPASYSFEASSEIVESLAHSYGKWQNTECRQMKEDLMEMDPDGNGKVPLSTFYSQPDNAEYRFTESVEYLRQIGALDESSKTGPKVRIANYLAGPSNCIASSSYYSVCCISDCEAVMRDVEAQVRAPAARPELLEAIVANVSEARPSRDLSAKLRHIADRHGGEVPLHGRLFAQWLHLALPTECPFPHVAEDAAALTPSHWQDKAVVAPQTERQRHIAEAGQSDLEEQMHWCDHEVLLVEDSVSSQRRSGSSLFSFRGAVQLAVLIVVLRIAVGAFQSAAHGLGGSTGKDKVKGFELPF